MLAPCPAAPPSWLLLRPGFHKRAAPSLSFVPQASLPPSLPLSPSPQAAPPGGRRRLRGGGGGGSRPGYVRRAGKRSEASGEAGRGQRRRRRGVLCHARSADRGDCNAGARAQAEARPGSPLKGGEDGQAGGGGFSPRAAKESFVSPPLPRHPCSVGGRRDICAPVESSGDPCACGQGDGSGCNVCGVVRRICALFRVLVPFEVTCFAFLLCK